MAMPDLKHVKCCLYAARQRILNTTIDTMIEKEQDATHERLDIIRNNNLIFQIEINKVKFYSVMKQTSLPYHRDRQRNTTYTSHNESKCNRNC